MQLQLQRVIVARVIREVKNQFKRGVLSKESPGAGRESPAAVAEKQLGCNSTAVTCSFGALVPLAPPREIIFGQTPSSAPRPWSRRRWCFENSSIVSTLASGHAGSLVAGASCQVHKRTSIGTVKFPSFAPRRGRIPALISDCLFCPTRKVGSTIECPVDKCGLHAIHCLTPAFGPIKVLVRL
jgi:hypothetical protein